MRYLHILGIFLLLLGNISCSTYSGTLSDKQNKETYLVEISNDLEERDRQLTTGIKDLADAIPIELQNDYTNIIADLAEEDQRIEGLPVEKLPVMQLMQDLNKKDKFLEAYKNQNTKLLQDARLLTKEISVLQKQLEEQKDVSGWFGSLWGWITGLGVSGIILLIVLIILFPSIGIPLLTQIIGWFISLVPQLVNMFGIVAKSVFENVVSGVESFKKEIKNNPQKTYSHDEVIEILKRNLSDHTSKKAKNTIDIVRRKK